MKIFQYFFYIYFLAILRKFGQEEKYPSFDAILSGITFSIFLTINILTILLGIGYKHLITMFFNYFGVFGIFLFPIPAFIFVFFMCIYKKKYLKIVEHFRYVNKNWKTRLLAALIGLFYTVGSVVIFGLVFYHVKT